MFYVLPLCGEMIQFAQPPLRNEFLKTNFLHQKNSQNKINKESISFPQHQFLNEERCPVPWRIHGCRTVYLATNWYHKNQPFKDRARFNIHGSGYIYLHLVNFNDKLVGKYIVPPMGSVMGQSWVLPSLKLTASLPLKMDGWNTMKFPFGAAFWPIFGDDVCYFQGGCSFSWLNKVASSGNLNLAVGVNSAEGMDMRFCRAFLRMLCLVDMIEIVWDSICFWWFMCLYTTYVTMYYIYTSLSFIPMLKTKRGISRIL